ncbi:MAG: hypothetical protein ABWY12_11840 [Burkholderiales bacterium]
METSVKGKSVYHAIDEINMSDRRKAAAKARMRDAELIAGGIWRATDILSRLGRAVLIKGARTRGAHASKQGI